MLEPKIYSVSRVNGYIRTMLENDFVLSSIWVAGEISNFKRHSSGHMYFSLKDSDGVIRCVMFRGDADILPFMPENGMSVIVKKRRISDSCPAYEAGRSRCAYNSL